MATRKKKPAYTYSHNPIKPNSSLKRYEILREVGVLVPTGIGDQMDLITGNALDLHIDRIIYERNKAAEP